MNRAEKNLKAALDAAIFAANAPPGPIHRKLRDLLENSVNDDDDVPAIAAKALSSSFALLGGKGCRVFQDLQDFSTPWAAESP